MAPLEGLPCMRDISLVILVPQCTPLNPNSQGTADTLQENGGLRKETIVENMTVVNNNFVSECFVQRLDVEIFLLLRTDLGIIG